MIPLTDVEQEPEDSALLRLEDLLRSGMLAAASDQKRLGESLRKVTHALEEHGLQPSLEAYLPALKLSSSHLSHRAEVEQWVRRIWGLAQGLQAASTRDELEALLQDIRVLTTNRNHIARDLSRAWRDWIEAGFARHVKLGALLGRFSGTESLGRGLAQLASEGLGLAEEFPPSVTSAQRARELASHRDEILEDLRAKQETKELLGFLDRVLLGEATLEHVSPRLRGWLESNHALGLLRVTL